MCVLGLGLIGGSLLRAAAKAGRTAWGYNRSAATVAEASADGFDVSADLTATLARAQQAGALIVVAVPMPAVDQVLAAVAEHAPGCPLTDVVSVKGPVVEAVARHGLAARYVGGHPMAGTADSGWPAGSADLFRDAVWVVCDGDPGNPPVRALVERLAHDCGARIVAAAPDEHDDAVARISHLPHLLAEALACVGADDGLALQLAAGSFRDGTRVAGTAPALVRAMCEANAESLLGALDEALELLERAREELAGPGTVAELVEAGHRAHRRYLAARGQR
ncbi:prephenate dehydrogenase [Rhodococcus sp. D2-41]|nr:prephenate dehydrogenase [Rhodococcus sp. D2-41]